MRFFVLHEKPYFIDGCDDYHARVVMSVNHDRNNVIDASIIHVSASIHT